MALPLTAQRSSNQADAPSPLHQLVTGGPGSASRVFRLAEDETRPDLPVVRVLELLFVPQRGHGRDARSSTRRSVAGQGHGTQKNPHGGSQCQRIIGLDPIKK
jgi:hypothetical protein